MLVNRILFSVCRCTYIQIIPTLFLLYQLNYTTFFTIILNTLSTFMFQYLLTRSLNSHISLFWCFAVFKFFLFNCLPFFTFQYSQPTYALVTCLISICTAIRVDFNTNKGPIIPPTPRTTIRPVAPFREPAPVWEDQSNDIPNPNPYT